MTSDRVVVITGAAGGMGALFVGRFLANGDTVVAVDIDEEGLGRLTAEFGSDAPLLVLPVDVADERSCDGLAVFVRERVRRVDVLVNCAGFFPTRALDQLRLADWNKVIGINLTGVFLMVKALLPLMTGRGWGRIVNIGSASVFDGVADQAHYVAAKAGVLGFSRSLARSVGKSGITVNVVTPGLTATPKVKATIPPEMLEGQIGLRAIQREEVGKDLVGAVFFLASPDADFISGQTVNVDGGKHLL